MMAAEGLERKKYNICYTWPGTGRVLFKAIALGTVRKTAKVQNLGKRWGMQSKQCNTAASFMLLGIH